MRPLYKLGNAAVVALPSPQHDAAHCATRSAHMPQGGVFTLPSEFLLPAGRETSASLLPGEHLCHTLSLGRSTTHTLAAVDPALALPTGDGDERGGRGSPDHLLAARLLAIRLGLRLAIPRLALLRLALLGGVWPRSPAIDGGRVAASLCSRRKVRLTLPLAGARSQAAGGRSPARLGRFSRDFTELRIGGGWRHIGGGGDADPGIKLVPESPQVGP